MIKKLKKMGAFTKLSSLFLLPLLIVLTLLLLDSCSYRRESGNTTDNNGQSHNQTAVITGNQIAKITSKQSIIEKKLNAIAKIAESFESDDSINTELKNINNTIAEVVESVQSRSPINTKEKLEAIRLLLIDIKNVLNSFNVPSPAAPSQDLRVVQAEIEHLFDLVRYAKNTPCRICENTNVDISNFEHSTFIGELTAVIIIGILTLLIGLLTVASYFARRWIYNDILDVFNNKMEEFKKEYGNKILCAGIDNHVRSYMHQGLLHFINFDNARKEGRIDKALKADDGVIYTYYEQLHLAIEFGRLSILELNRLLKIDDKDSDKYKAIVLSNTAYYLTDEWLYNKELSKEDIEANKKEALKYILDTTSVLERLKKDQWEMWHKHKDSQLYVLKALGQINANKLKESLKEIMNYDTALLDQEWQTETKQIWKIVLNEEEWKDIFASDK